MDINYILENEELKKYLSDSIGKTYNKYKLYGAIEFDDFTQECYIKLLKSIKSFNESKSNIKTYISLIVMTTGKRAIYNAIGNSDERNKLEIKNNTLSLDYDYREDENGICELESVIGFEENYDNKVLLNEMLSMPNLNETQKDILKLLSKGYNKSEIGVILHKNRVTISIAFKGMKEKILRKYGA